MPNRADWRTLDQVEIALMKRMKLNGMARDPSMSFFIRPGRVISPAVFFELDEKRPDIAPASVSETEQFMSRRLAEASAERRYPEFGPTSSIRVHEILQLSRPDQAALPGFESHNTEFKRCVPDDKLGKAKIAKTMAAFSNHAGGYLFLGIEDGGEIVGVDRSGIEDFWDEIAGIVAHAFTPFFQWDRSVVEVAGLSCAVMYVYECVAKPVVATKDFTAEIKEGQIFFRYARSSRTIRAGELIGLLNERDKRIVDALMSRSRSEE